MADKKIERIEDIAGAIMVKSAPKESEDMRERLIAEMRQNQQNIALRQHFDSNGCLTMKEFVN